MSLVADIAAARRDALPFMHKGPLGRLAPVSHFSTVLSLVLR